MGGVDSVWKTVRMDDSVGSVTGFGCRKCGEEGNYPFALIQLELFRIITLGANIMALSCCRVRYLCCGGLNYVLIAGEKKEMRLTFGASI
ncbi:hypothetical protein FEM48_Zijuj12G0138000 [Ziziphus jujuba var. spinosa]|uniref:Uncharacterized protein n=1 Tax=Ziziphus jujuba var. spinosa TaxID=714518 RepID=A0A978UDP5_ZIZJJ|nr:hypothetical protein FEM48_Zijuj12G0138000 [Ziziphus jujuba var. spinosa]